MKWPEAFYNIVVIETGEDKSVSEKIFAIIVKRRNARIIAKIALSRQTHACADSERIAQKHLKWNGIFFLNPQTKWSSKQL